VDTALYYFLSTIAQTLGGVAALLGAVVLFRLQAIWEQASRAAEYLHNSFDHPDSHEMAKMEESWIRGDLKAVLEQSKRRPADGTRKAKYEQTRSTLKNELQNAEELRRRFWKAIAITALLVTVAIVLIPVVPTRMMQDASVRWLVAALTLWLLACFAFYVRVLSSALTRRSSDDAV
jgi:cation transport ATPase